MNKKFNTNFEVSVIIPVYNAEKYVEKAVLSALDQPEVKEVIVIEDGSMDKSLEIVYSLQMKMSRVKVYQHPLGKNRGRSKSRNLGIKKSSFDFIAFLDADDYFLANRFKNDEILFTSDPGIDGVYNAIGVRFYRSPKDKQEEENLELTTIRKKVAPEELFRHKWPRGELGAFHGDGLTVKKKIFYEVDFFNEELEVAEDSELFIKFSLKARLFPGELGRAVAIRGVHDSNIFVQTNQSVYRKAYYQMFMSLYEWSKCQELTQDVTDFFAEEAKKYYLKVIAIDKRGLLNVQDMFFAFSDLWNRRKKKALFHLIPVLFFYKITGKGYIFRRRLKANV